MESSSDYRLIEVKDCRFFRGEHGPVAHADGITYELVGNAYILNEDGHTVDSFLFNQTGRKIA